MARIVETLVTQSLLDRLASTEDWPATRAHSLRFFKESLKRDMEWLLNTRQPPIAGIDSFDAASRSVIHYGLIDTSSLSHASLTDHKRIQQAVQECITNFEPRLQNTTVTIADGDLKKRQLRFHIEGQIRLDPAPEEILFDTVLDLTSGEYVVS